MAKLDLLPLTRQLAHSLGRSRVFLCHILLLGSSPCDLFPDTLGLKDYHDTSSSCADGLVTRFLLSYT